jgi:hypothetical protein
MAGYGTVHCVSQAGPGSSGSVCFNIIAFALSGFLLGCNFSSHDTSIAIARTFFKVLRATAFRCRRTTPISW